MAEITGWRLTKTANNPAWASSSTAGWKDRVVGVKDASGSFDYKFDATNFVPIEEGDDLQLKLYVNASKFYTVNAVIDSVSIEVDMNDGEVVGGTCDFSTQLVVTFT